MGKSFTARVDLESKQPTLLLEQYDMHLKDVQCHGSIINLRFYEHGAMLNFHEELLKHSHWQVLTSHEGCNDDGGRRPHRQVQPRHI